MKLKHSRCYSSHFILHPSAFILSLSSSLRRVEGPVVCERLFDIDLDVEVIAHHSAQIINLFLFVAAQKFAASFVGRNDEEEARNVARTRHVGQLRGSADGCVKI